PARPRPRLPHLTPPPPHPTKQTAANRDAWRLARGWGRAEPWRASALVAAALGLILLQLAVDWGFALWHRAAFDALEARDGPAFLTQIRLRENSEAVALIGGEAEERRGLAAAYGRVEATTRRMFGAERSLMWLGCCYMPVAGVLPLLLGAPQCFAGAITLGVLMQMAHAFTEVTRALCWLTENWPRLADWRCHVARVVALEHALDAPAGPSGQLRRVENSPVLDLRDVALATPCGRALLQAPY
ncbi:MAG: hypothetical protein O9325_07355, partial [Roseomonas sp.]|nr:hypothetical protein [Roseomonas sp.]